jgi:predicted porin
MQKKLIALAIAGLAAAPAFAQTNVTIYGVADVDIENIRTSSTTVTGAGFGARMRVTTNSSLIGFKGSEDLGNGMKAIFLYESGVSFDNNTGLTGGRDAYVGLSSGFGTMILGTATGPFRAIGSRYDLTPGATGIGALTGFGGLGQGSGILGQVGSGNSGVSSSITGAFNSAGGAGYTWNSRTPNAIAYISPDLMGFKAVIGYSANEGKSQQGANPPTNPYAWEIGVGYAGGPFNADFAFRQHKNLSALNTAYYDTTDLINVANRNQGSNQDGYRLGLSYAFGFGLKLSGIYEYLDFEDAATFIDTTTGLAGNGTASAHRSAWSLGASYDMGPHNFIVQGGYADKLKGDVASNNDTSGNMWVFRYAYNMSKRTQAYALYSAVNNGSDVNYDFGGGGGDPFQTGNLPKGSTVRGFGAGIRHTF